jgi:RimJ/RimL family protein N-acetyltransferase
MTIRINDAHSIKLIAQAADIALGAKIHCIAHYDNNDTLTGGVLLMNDNGHSMEIHSAGFKLNWGRQELLWAVFNYVFRVRGIKKLFGRVPEENHRARKFNKHLGFKEEAIIDDVFSGGEGLVVMGMYEEDCKFLTMKLPKVEFAPIEKTDIVEVYQYSQSKAGD